MPNFELFSKKDALSICALDTKSGTLTTSPKEYISSNGTSYYVLLNTWGNLFFQYAPISGDSFKAAVSQKGLVPMIDILSKEATKFINDDKGFLPFSLQLINEVQSDQNWQRIFLLLLRFGKRFSPSHADVVAQATLDDFISTENRTKLLQRRDIPLWLLNSMKEEISGVLKKFKVCPEDRYFSNGVCSDGKFLLDKVEAIGKMGLAPWGLEYPIPCEYVGIPYTENKYGLMQINAARIVTVPKSYKSARIIAEEESYRQYENTAVYKGILRCMKKSKCYPQFCIEDQEMNRSKCLQASIDLKFATIDLSHASDCVSKALVKSVFPDNVLAALSLLPNTALYTVKGKEKSAPLQMAATAGSVLTFCIETLVFWSIARTAKGLFESLCSEKIPDVSVYGDDIIVPTQIAELTIDLLERLGFMVNREKSFYGQFPYRETCGAEYFNGYDVATKYWPRKVLLFDVDKKGVIKGDNTNLSLTSIIPLQHALYEHVYARQFLSGFVRSIYPDFTSSNPADGLNDLWEDFPLSTKAFPPHLKGTTCPSETVRELHYNSITTYGKAPEKANSSVYDTYRYCKFLREGPRFENPLLELLGVSSPDAPLNEVCSKPQIKWKKMTE